MVQTLGWRLGFTRSERPSDLKNGDNVRFRGQTDMTFLDAAHLRDFALKCA
ncbi:MAG: hypothetical protein O7A71_06485 [Chloroflexi bacterium]|nr:hypothetical protein [Chloroflexota bacterium]